MVKIVAAMCWFDEPVDFLDRAVSSLAGTVDELLALDGRWKLFDDESPAFLSDDEQARAIADAAKRAGLTVSFGVVPGVWPSQVAKRDRVMRQAAKRGDWVLVYDGDEWIESCDREALDELLESTDTNVALAMTCPVGMEARQPMRPAPVRKLYRSSPSLRVEVAHNGYRDDTGWLHGDPAYVRLVKPVDASRVLRIGHEGRARGERRNGLAMDYRMARRREQVEAWR